MKVDETRLLADLEHLGKIGLGPEGGITRRALSREDAAARAYVADRMRAAGLEVRHDEVGNLRGRRKGRDGAAWDSAVPVVMTGSHLDSVPSGGKLDGPLGVVGAVCAIESLNAAGVTTKRPLEVIVFVGEEGSRFRRGTIGSAAVSGHVSVADVLELVDPDGAVYKDALATYGDEGAAIPARAAAGSIHAFVELHVEQGGVLEAAALPIGAVTTIAGLVQRAVTFLGDANHAGATPMNLRHDAFLAAAEWALGIERGAREIGGGVVGTVGKLTVEPGGKNIIPGRVDAICDLRAPTPVLLSALDDYVVSSLHGIGEKRGVELEQQLLQRVEPGPMHELAIVAVQRAAAEAGLGHMRMPSGAIHDALHMAEIAPSSMIFVPSIGGKSHCPTEATDPRHLAQGVAVLAHTLAILANDP
ncbi:MAG: amidase, hydantoinase/carbamoylase family [Myxococcales bacterium]|nr:amidase, hydantoinase/carbamoylase family [Myxococcales bacterium]